MYTINAAVCLLADISICISVFSVSSGQVRRRCLTRIVFALLGSWPAATPTLLQAGEGECTRAVESRGQSVVLIVAPLASVARELGRTVGFFWLPVHACIVREVATHMR